MLSRLEKTCTLVALALVIGLLALANSFLNQYYLRLINVMGINIILVVSLNLTNGLTGVFSLGHPGFMAVGAYTAALLTIPLRQKAFILPDLPAWLAQAHASFPVALLAAGTVAAICAFLIGYPVLRLRGHYLALATLGFLVIAQVVVTNVPQITRGARGINGLPPETNIWWVYGIAIALIYLSWRLVHSAYGRGMMAIRGDDLAAEALGVNLVKHRMLAFTLGAFFAGVGGALWGHLITVVSPHAFSFAQAFMLVVMSVIGGMGSITGSIIGAVVMTLIPEALRGLEVGTTIAGFHIPPLYGLSQVIYSVALIIVLALRPQGIVGRREFSWRRWLKNQGDRWAQAAGR